MLNPQKWLKNGHGKLNKFFKDNTLMAQSFVKDGNKSVADYLKSVDADITVTEFKRVALGSSSSIFFKTRFFAGFFLAHSFLKFIFAAKQLRYAS